MLKVNDERADRLRGLYSMRSAMNDLLDDRKAMIGALERAEWFYSFAARPHRNAIDGYDQWHAQLKEYAQEMLKLSPLPKPEESSR